MPTDTREDYAKLYRDYEETLKKNNAMDFDDLIWRTVQLFREGCGSSDYYRKNSVT